MKYGKLIGGILMYAPSTLNIEGMVHYHPSDDKYIEMGYLPIVETPQPEQTEEEEIKYYKEFWSENDGLIVRGWEESIPEEQAPSLADRVAGIEAKQAEQDVINAEFSDALVELAEIATEVA